MTPRAWVPLLGLAFYTGCTACYGGPATPAGDDTEPVDTEPVDSPVDSPVDTQPPPPCAWPEVEPNYNTSLATPIGAEDYACGTFGTAWDVDTYTLSLPGGWLEFRVEAAERGSPAAPLLIIEGEELASSDASYGSSDPRIVTRVDDPDDWTVTLTQASDEAGEEYEYRFIILQAKAPVDYQDVSEGHKSSDDPYLLEVGQSVLGLANTQQGHDWYRVELPGDLSAPKGVTYRIDVDAYSYGSPLDSKIAVYEGTDDPELDADGDGVADAAAMEVDRGEDLENDPVADWTVQDEGDVIYVTVRQQQGATYGDLYWYVLTVRAE